MALKNKYQREKQQYSNDSGRTWIDVSPANYRRGRLIEAGSDDCNTVEWKEVTGSWFCIGFNETQYRWVTVSDEYVCVGYDKYEKLKKQESIDGVNWTDVVPLETQTGSLIEANSTDCGYVPPVNPYTSQYLTIEALTRGTLLMWAHNTSVAKTISYSTDGGSNWTNFTTSTSAYSFGTLNVGDKILFKGVNASYGAFNNYNQFGGTAQFKVYGNIMSLIVGDNFETATTLDSVGYNFYKLFYETNVVNAENLILPATTLARNCYDSIFAKCTSLTTAPQLPAMTLVNRCYYYMFYKCTSLTTAPILPARTLATYCYEGMFDGCTNLTTAPSILPATTLAECCYQHMFENCTSLTSAPELPATTLADYCYYQMFYGCTSLTTAPELLATTLVNSCYQSMFEDCTSLNYVKCLATDISADSCTNSWLSNVSTTGTFVKDASMTDWGYGIPTGWTVQNA